MIVDGKKLAEEIKTSLKNEVGKLGGKKLKLAVVQVGRDPATNQFLEQKKKFGMAVGVDVRVYQLSEDISTNALREKVSEIIHIKENTAVIVQLPLPPSINTAYILDSITPEKDADMLSSKSVGLFANGRSKIFPPVVGAVKYILEKNSVDVRSKNVVVVGAGRLVGKPVATWLTNVGATVTVCDEHTVDISAFTKQADIVISGVGKPGLIKLDMVQDNVVLIDAGTSESAGKVVGDADLAVAEKASIFTPVPGGVGPVTVAMLFQNVVELGK